MRLLALKPIASLGRRTIVRWPLKRPAFIILVAEPELLCCFLCFLLFFLTAPLSTSLLAVSAPLVTSLRPSRLRSSICCGEHRRWRCKAQRSRQSKGKSSSTRNQFRFDFFKTHGSLLLFFELLATRMYSKVRRLASLNSTSGPAAQALMTRVGLSRTLILWPSTHVPHPGSENLFREVLIDIRTYELLERENGLLIFHITALRSFFR